MSEDNGATAPLPVEEWKKDARGHEYVAARGRSGRVVRQGEESIEEAHTRDAKGPKDKRPKRKPVARKAPAPTALDLRELEKELVDAFAAPGLLFAMRGDEWGTAHFTTEGPKLARNLVKCAEHDPWLREKLTLLAAGDGAMQRIMLYGYLGGSVFAYVVPPIIHYMNPPLPERADKMLREHYSIPERPPTFDLADLESDFGAPAPPAPAEAAAAS